MQDHPPSLKLRKGFSGKNTARKKVAVFDIDGTVFRSSLLIELVETLIEMGVFQPRTRYLYKKEWELWLDRKGSYENYINAVVKAFAKNIRGVQEKTMERAVNTLLNKHQDHVYRYTRDLITRLKKRGYFLLAISHSPSDVARQFARGMGFDKVYARFYELDAEEHFTGKTLMSEWIDDKARILKRAVEKENLMLKDSVGVGDTLSDAGMLKLVDHPICFNPNEALLKVASRNNWPVVVERKDVIYLFDPQ